jgi:glycerol-3-phosphate dehydrogenase (NAD(P)+)
LSEAHARIQQVVEGVPAARAVYDVSRRLQVDMPICHEIFRILHEGKAAREVVVALMGRDVRSETD